ncbi:MAG: NAD(P)H-dependent oxidoreductase [Planctomycetes bacterium]|nr:NAD(P)H-dependent oxidoreductase [Planctomycetota bacterium]MCH9725680.1 NAD(P)H-dependent oxidoreductase [Planctomycetota bacterium]MCH9777734.1 NAD(P)H-dependent oxidoreductase [Planctomycetota bacterium]MCH9790932.1 NAD(P)H-dependent oxidoreductase [Planctomycetota bacterium]
MQNVTIIATSLNPKSKSQILARQMESHLVSDGVHCQLFDLRELNIGMSGPNENWGNADIAKIAESVKQASHVVFAVPIYCYDVNSAAKNIIELTGRSFTNKVISFLCAAGGTNSYMSVMSFANHLMLDFRSIIVPRFLYTQDSDWSEEGILNESIQERFELLIGDMRMIQVDTSHTE